MAAEVVLGASGMAAAALRLTSPAPASAAAEPARKFRRDSMDRSFH
jgi:hypothetical protein